MSPSRYAWEGPNDDDIRLFERELRDFVPPDAFDGHAHLYDPALLVDSPHPLASQATGPVDWACYQRRVGAWLPGRCPTGGLFFPYPMPGLDVTANNAWLTAELARQPESRGLMLITPTDDPATVEEQLTTWGFAGFKVYHVYAGRPDTFHADTAEFLPDWAWEIADRRGLAIMLHMVLPRALAEPANQAYIVDRCRRYPGAKLILAHGARGFNGRHTAEGIAALRGLGNVWFDSSGICESLACEAILRTFGPSRLMFATDFPVSEMRTRCVDLGDGFAWLNELEPDFSRWSLGRPTLTGLESLLALRDACRALHLTDDDVEQIFCRTGRDLVGIPHRHPLPDVQDAYRHAKTLIPGGTQLLSKRPEMFAPDVWPAYYREARGVETIDLARNRYTDMSTGGILACILGYADPDVNAAVIRRVNAGSMASLQTYDEVELLELLLAIHPWAAMGRFARTGGEAMAVAVRIARAATGRDGVLICGYHGWHDWYLAANLATDEALNGHLLPGLAPSGVPRALAGTTRAFRYNRLDELDAAIDAAGGKIGVIVMETTRHTDPEPGFLEGVRERATRMGAILVFDEISIGWRLCLGGAHLKYGVSPDLAVYAKAISNGYAMGAVIGRAEVMEAAQGSFISSAYWTEGVGPAAALASVRKQQSLDVTGHLARIGGLVADGWRELGARHGLPLRLTGRPEMAVFAIDHPDAAALLTLFTTRMLRRGFLANATFNATCAHQPHHVDAYLTAVDAVFAELAEAIDRGDAAARLEGPVKHTGFARLT